MSLWWFAQVGVQALAETLGHFVWQGTLIACALWLALFALRGADPQARYLVGCLALLSSVLAPVATFALLCSAHSAPHGVIASSLQHPASGGARAPLVVVAWACGCLYMGGRLAHQWLQGRRLLAGSSEAPGAWAQRLARLCAKLAIVVPVQLRLSDAIDTPVVVGWLRPVVLLPAAALTSLPVPYWEALLAHELGHIKRLDYLVNALQCVVQAVLFYHPAVHWIGRCMRRERELSCDDIAVAICGDRLCYARALTEMEGLRAQLSEATVASTGGDLMQRIQYVVSGSKEGHVGRVPGVAALFLSASLLASVAGVWACSNGSLTPSSQAVAFEAGAVPVAWMPETMQQWAPTFVEAAERHGVDPSLLAVVTLAESRGDPNAKGPSGAVGLMQILPATAGHIERTRHLEAAPHRLVEPEYNVDLGAWYLARQLARFGLSKDSERAVELAAIAYNGGPQVADRYGQGDTELNDETRAYRDLVVGMWRERDQPVSQTFTQWQQRSGG